jgi:hypothetical protein
MPNGGLYNNSFDALLKHQLGRNFTVGNFTETISGPVPNTDVDI